MGDVSDRQMYLDAQEVVSSGKLPEGLLSTDAKEIPRRAFIFLHAVDQLNRAIELLGAEVSLERGPEVLNRTLEELGGVEEGDEPEKGA